MTEENPGGSEISQEMRNVLRAVGVADPWAFATRYEKLSPLEQEMGISINPELFDSNTDKAFQFDVWTRSGVQFRAIFGHSRLAVNQNKTPSLQEYIIGAVATIGNNGQFEVGSSSLFVLNLKSRTPYKDMLKMYPAACKKLAALAGIETPRNSSGLKMLFEILGAEFHRI